MTDERVVKINNAGAEIVPDEHGFSATIVYPPGVSVVPDTIHIPKNIGIVGVPIKKRRGRPPGKKKIPTNLPPPDNPEAPKPKGKRPPCEDLTTKYPLRELIFYEEDYKHKGIGVFHDPAKGNMVAIMSFLRLDDGSLKWAYRPVPKVGGGVLMHHDMTLVSPSNLIPLSKALEKVAVEWFGGQKKADEARIEYQEEKKSDSLGEKIRKANVF